MKRILFLSVLLSVVIMAGGQPFATVVEEYGPVATKYQAIESPSRTLPPGSLIYSQPFVCPPYNGLRSETYSTDSETADDFVIPGAANIDVVRWWFMFNDDPLLTDWNIRIYDDAACLPSSLLQQWTIPAYQVDYELVCNAFARDIYDCWAFLAPAFVPTPGAHYWISIQAVGYEEYWCMWGSEGDFLNCPGAFKSAYFGYPDFVPDDLLLGHYADFTFELYESTGPPCWNISLIGEFSGWMGDHWMDQDPFDPSIWTTWIIFTNEMNQHGDPDIIEVKFRQDGDWAVNWGAPDFPTGMAYQSGPNIPVPIRLYAPEDSYLVTFNCSTGEYTFTSSQEIPLSTWAIALGVFLILMFAVVRYRRM